MLRKVSFSTISKWKPSFSSPINLISLDSILSQKNSPIQTMISSNKSQEFQRFFTKKADQSIPDIQQPNKILFTDPLKIKEYESRCEKGDLQAISEYAPCLLFGINGVQCDSSKAAKYFKIGSEKHDTESTFYYGFCLFNGQGVKTDFSKAASLFKESAEKGKTQSFLYLYYCYNEGKGVQKDENQAISYLQTAADRGLPYAITLYGVRLPEDDPKKYEYLKKAAELGEIEGQFHYGSFLIRGNSVLKADKGKGFFYLVKAAEGGLAAAQNYIGDVFMQGIIGPKDEGMAVHYYELSASQNDCEGNYKLSQIYMKNESKQSEYLRYLKKAADLGHKEAIIDYGEMIYWGRFPKLNDKKEAAKYIKMAADNGNERSMLLYAEMAESGTGFYRKEPKIADKYYKMASDVCKSIRAYKSYMRFLNKNRRFSEANKYMILAGKAGDSDCLYGSALYYYVNKNHAECEKCLKLSIDKGNADAMNFYGSIMISKKPQESLNMLKKAIEKGSVPAMFTYASYLIEGRFPQSLSVDKSEAFKYMKMAADNNFKEAVIKCADMLHDGKFCDKNVKDSLIYYKKAADLFNIPSAQFVYGDALLSGCDGLIEINQKVGASYVKKAADQKFAEAVFRLGKLYRDGIGFEKSDQNAFQCFKKAADSGVVDSLKICGCSLFNGKGVKKNQQEAAKYFKKGVDVNDPVCMFNLGLLYMSGEGVEKDNVKGKIYLEMASKNGFKDALQIGEKVYSQKISATQFIKE